MTGAGVNFVAEPAGVGKSIAVGPYRLDVGPSVGTSITPAPEATAAATEAQTQLARAVVQDHRDERKPGGVVDFAERSSEGADGVTDRVEEANTLWKEVSAGQLDVGTVNSQIDSLLGLLQKLDRTDRFDEQLRLARSLSRLLAVALRWLDLLRSLRATLAAAERHGDRSAQAWASHELGTLRLAGNDLLGADRALGRAAELRKEIGDSRGLAATERNLQVLCRTLRQLMRDGRMTERRGVRRFLHAPLAFVLVLFLLAFAAATVAIAETGVFSGGGAPAAVVRTIDHIAPSSGPAAGGTTVTITGTRLQHAAAVSFGRVHGRGLRQLGATKLRVIAPPGSGTVPVTVITAHGDSVPSAAAHFTYIAPTGPTITGIAPGHGDERGRTAVVITGAHLQGAKAVKFGGASGAILQRRPTTLRVTTPPGSGTVAVQVITPNGKSPAGPRTSFHYDASTSSNGGGNTSTTQVTTLSISGITPPNGPGTGGTPVTIRGIGLAQAIAVTLGDNRVEFNHVGDLLQFDTPPGSGTATVTVATKTKVATSMFAYIPVITDISPHQALAGESLTITGAGLASPTAVTFAGADAATPENSSDTSLTVAVPTNLPTVDCGTQLSVTVTTAGGTSAPESFTYECPTSAVR